MRTRRLVGDDEHQIARTVHAFGAGNELYDISAGDIRRETGFDVGRVGDLRRAIFRYIDERPSIRQRTATAVGNGTRAIERHCRAGSHFLDSTGICDDNNVGGRLHGAGGDGNVRGIGDIRSIGDAYVARGRRRGLLIATADCDKRNENERQQSSVLMVRHKDRTVLMLP